jgi:O-antigen/teichoic acid export membrane protein
MLGIETLINKKLPELNVADPSGRQGRYLLQRLLTFRLVTSSIFCIFLYFVLPHYLEFINKQELLEYRSAVLMYFLVITVNSFLSTLFMTQLRYKVVSITETISAALNLVLLAVFVMVGSGIFGVLYAYILATAMNILIYIWLSRAHFTGETEAPNWGDMKPLALTSYGMSLFSFGLMTQSDVLLLNFFQVSDADVGYYHLATSVGAMLAFVLTGIGPLALSMFSEVYARDSVTGLSKIWCQVLGLAAFLTTPIYVFAFFNAESLLTFLFGATYAGATMVFALYIFFACAQTVLGWDFTTSTLFILHRRKTVLRSTIEGSMINILLNIILIPAYGVVGAVFATGLVMVYMVLRQLYVIQREVQIGPAFPVIGKCFLFSLAAAVMTKGTAWFVEDHILFNAAVYLAAFAGLLIWIKPFTQEHRRLISELHPSLDQIAKMVTRGEAL